MVCIRTGIAADSSVFFRMNLLFPGAIDAPGCMQSTMRIAAIFRSVDGRRVRHNIPPAPNGIPPENYTTLPPSNSRIVASARYSLCCAEIRASELAGSCAAICESSNTAAESFPCRRPERTIALINAMAVRARDHRMQKVSQHRCNMQTHWRGQT